MHNSLKKTIALFASLFVVASAMVVLISDNSVATESNVELNDGLYIDNSKELKTLNGSTIPDCIKYSVSENTATISINKLTINIPSNSIYSSGGQYHYAGICCKADGAYIEKVIIEVKGENKIVLPSNISITSSTDVSVLGIDMMNCELNIVGTDPSKDSLKIVFGTFSFTDTPNDDVRIEPIFCSTNLSITDCELDADVNGGLYQQSIDSTCGVSLLRAEIGNLYVSHSIVKLTLTDCTKADRIEGVYGILFNNIDAAYLVFSDSDLTIEIGKIGKSGSYSYGMECYDDHTSFSNTKMDIKVDEIVTGTNGHVLDNSLSVSDFSDYKSIKSSTTIGAEPTEITGTSIGTDICHLQVDAVGAYTPPANDDGLEIIITITVTLLLMLASVIIVVVGRYNHN